MDLGQAGAALERQADATCREVFQHDAAEVVLLDEAGDEPGLRRREPDRFAEPPAVRSSAAEAAAGGRSFLVPEVKGNRCAARSASVLNARRRLRGVQNGPANRLWNLNFHKPRARV